MKYTRKISSESMWIRQQKRSLFSLPERRPINLVYPKQRISWCLVEELSSMKIRPPFNHSNNTFKNSLGSVLGHSHRRQRYISLSIVDYFGFPKLRTACNRSFLSKCVKGWWSYNWLIENSNEHQGSTEENSLQSGTDDSWTRTSATSANFGSAAITLDYL